MMYMAAAATLPRVRTPLLTDLYQLTMAYGYWKSGVHRKEAVFNLFYRKNPFGSGYAIACGLADVVDLLRDFRFTEGDADYLGSLTGNDGQPLFERAFLDELRRLRLECSIEALPEGTAVFPFEPLLRVSGPILQAQLLETPLLNILNFQTLVATKAARICQAAEGDPVLEFGLRRSQGADGGLVASRAAYIGGCAGTSNVLAGRLFDIPVKGTHAHSWVMAFDSEPESFATYAEVLPNNCVFLVDTYDTLAGVRHAIDVGRRLREQGHEMVGIRLDSGDLSFLSIAARQLLDEAGFPDAAIVASNELDEHIIASLKAQGARIGVWGVGTKLATAFDQPALGGVYKLAAIRSPGEPWRYRIKLSEQAIKIPIPGVLQVRRFRQDGFFAGDMLFDQALPLKRDRLIVDRADFTRRKTIAEEADYEDMLAPVMDRGEIVYDSPDIHGMRERTLQQLGMLHAGIRRFVHPHEYPVGLELGLHERMTALVAEARHGREL